MANTFFQFKQFTIHQDQCAMKVSTEACIQGAWVPDIKPKRILDIGAGTGLLALMLAQRMNAQIDAVELDAAAAIQAKQNVVNSDWKNRIHVINQNVFEWAKNVNQKYNLIVSNPPFFTDSLKSETATKNLAKHDTSDFSKANLATVLKSLLSENGNAFILYPELEAEQFKVEVENVGLFYNQALIIRNQPNGLVFRIISMVSKSYQMAQPEELNIRSGNNHSIEFNNLMSTYYLRL